MFGLLRKSAARKHAVERLYASTVARARTPQFFTNLRVSDTVDGRFDILALHFWLVLGRLKAQGAGEFSQGLMDVIFTGFDEALRDGGAGDIGIGKRIKKIADAFFGRLGAYENCRDQAELADAILRNVYRGRQDCAREADILARYAMDAAVRLALCDLTAEAPEFGSMPELETAT